MRTTTRLAAAAAAVVAIGSLMLTGIGHAAKPAHKKLVFTVGTTNDIRTLNPLKGLETPEYETFFMVYDMLENFDVKTLAPVAGLATSWKKSPDGKTWTFTIRKGVKWSDGQPLTAHDIAFTYNFLIDNDITAFTNYLPFTDSITAPNDTTLIWKTKKPTIAPEAPPWIYILPEHIWGKFSAKEAKQFDNMPPVGSGPFRLVQWEKGQFWRLEANKQYWGGAPHIDEVVFRVFKNDEGMVNALKRGEIDIADNIPADLFESLKGVPGITQHVGAAATFTQMSMNNCKVQPACKKSTGSPALLDPRVRLAIAHAIDKKELVDKVLRGYGEPGTTVIPPAFARWHFQPPSSDLIDFNIPEANRILDQAGYKDTDGDGIREMPGGGKPLAFRFYLRTEDANSIKDGQFISSWLKQIGIKTENQSITDSKLVNVWYANDYDMYIWGWGPDPDPDFMLYTFITNECEDWSDTCFSDKHYDQLYLKQKTLSDPKERAKVVDEMQKIIYDKVPEIPLYYDNDLQAFRSDRWTGLVNQPQPQGYLVFAYGTYTYTNVRPVSANVGAASDSGIPGWVWIVIAAGVVLVVGTTVFVRRRSEEERA
jgi:peptide/nickel transport system substrate-binding protein